MPLSIQPRFLAPLLLVVLLGVLALVPSGSSAQEASRAGSSGFERAHAHNDYEHDRPLYDALDQNFKSVEADVYLVDGELLVAHDRHEVRPDRTLESLYLRPLRREIRANGGSVHRGDPDYFTLLVDIKSEAGPTYRALHRELKEYRPILTTFDRNRVEDGAVTAVVSGNRPRELMEGQRVRYAAYDGRLSDLGVSNDQGFMPLVSDSWLSNFRWQGVGPMPAEEREKLRNIVATAHADGQRVRFYATPEIPKAREAVWAELLAARVDYVNTDNLLTLKAYLAQNDPRPARPHVYWDGRAGGARVAGD